MIMTVFQYRCAACACGFKAPEIVGGYGQVLLRSEGLGTEAWVDALADPVFSEVGRHVKALPQVADLSGRAVGELVQAGFGVSCDRDADGSMFGIGMDPRCPACGSHQMEWREETHPAETVDRELPHVTHVEWESRSEAARSDLICEAVSRAQR